MDDDVRQQIDALRQEVTRLRDQVRQLQDPLGNVFLASPSGTNGTFAEVGPDAGGTSLATLADGRNVTATNTAGIMLIDRGTNRAMLMIPVGTNTAYVPISGGLDFYNGTVSAQLA